MQTLKLWMCIGMNLLPLGLMAQTGQPSTGVTYTASEAVPQGAIALPDTPQPHTASNVRATTEVYVASEEMVPGAIFLEQGPVSAPMPAQVPVQVPAQVPVQHHTIQSAAQPVPEEQKRQLSIPTLAPEIDDQGQLIDNTSIDISDPTQVIDVKGKAKEVTGTSDFVVPTRIIIPHIANPENDVLPIPVQSKILSAVDLNSEAIQPFEPKPDPVEYGDFPTCPVSFDEDAKAEQRQEKREEVKIPENKVKKKKGKQKKDKKKDKKKKKADKVERESVESDDSSQKHDKKSKEKKKKKDKKKNKKKNKDAEVIDESEE